MRILLLGGNGQLGWELQRVLAALGEVVAPTRQGPTWCGDLTQLDALRDTVLALRPDVVVNAAAYTAVDRAESEPQLAFQVNAEAPTVLAQACTQLGSLLVHYSTDYVFNGSGSDPWRETDTPAPINVYGQSKLEGERGIERQAGAHLVLRTSWVYGLHGNNFAKTMLRLARERDQLNVVDDQFGAPTNARWLAQTTALALQRLRGQGSAARDYSGVYHLCPAGVTTWHGYALWLFQQARGAGMTLRLQPEDVKAVPSSAYPSAAKRPHNSRLDCTAFESRFGCARPHWHDGLQEFLREYRSVQ